MTEIPDDVMKAAREAHAEFAKSSVRDNLTVIIARAILAERERCATVFEEYLTKQKDRRTESMRKKGIK